MLNTLLIILNATLKNIRCIKDLFNWTIYMRYNGTSVQVKALFDLWNMKKSIFHVAAIAENNSCCTPRYVKKEAFHVLLRYAILGYFHKLPKFRVRICCLCILCHLFSNHLTDLFDVDILGTGDRKRQGNNEIRWTMKNN